MHINDTNIVDKRAGWAVAVLNSDFSLPQLGQLEQHYFFSRPKQNSTLLVLLGACTFSNVNTMIRMALAFKHGHQIIPLLIDTGNPRHSFTFPDDEFYTTVLPELYMASRAQYETAQVTFAALSSAIRHLLQKVALTFVSNQSWAVQREVICELVRRTNPKYKTLTTGFALKTLSSITSRKQFTNSKKRFINSKGDRSKRAQKNKTVPFET